MSYVSEDHIDHDAGEEEAPKVKPRIRVSNKRLNPDVTI